MSFLTHSGWGYSSLVMDSSLTVTKMEGRIPHDQSSIMQVNTSLLI